MQNTHIDLTEGVIWKKLLLFFIPILGGSLFQQLYVTVDAVIIGQYAGKAGLAAIDSVYSLLKLPINFLTGLSVGASVIVSQLFGAKKHKELSEAVHTALASGLIGALILSALCIAAAPFCLRQLHVPASLFPQTLSYVRIYYAGFVFSMIYNISAGVLQAVGDSKTPFSILIAASTFNAATDMLFVGVFKWGVSGAAAATILAQLVSAFLILCALRRKADTFSFSVVSLRIYRSAFAPVVSLSLPIGLQSSLYPIANMMIQSGINSTGADAIAAWALCGKLDFLIWACTDSLAAAVSTFVAQNYGAGRYRRLRCGVVIGLGMTLAAVAVISTVLFIWNEPLGKLFINAADYDVIPLMGSIMRFLSPLYGIYVFGEVLSAAIRGSGETFKPMLLTLTGTCASRILWMRYIVPLKPSLFTIILSYPVSWALTACLFTVFYHFYKKKYFFDKYGRPVKSSQKNSL